MSGLTNLQETLNSLVVSCDELQYGFSTVVDSEGLSLDGVLATFVEEEGLTIIAQVERLVDLELEFEGPFAKLTIEVHTSLELVGLTAALATALTNAGVSANVVAAFYHDHIFVRWDQKAEAIAALEALKS